MEKVPRKWPKTEILKPGEEIFAVPGFALREARIKIRSVFAERLMALELTALAAAATAGTATAAPGTRPAATATAAGVFFPRTGFIYRQGAPLNLLPRQSRYGAFRAFRRSHGDKRKAA